ncbi:hypothetical protein CC79DRAFT_902824 [Sarocladium strictum]
MASNHSLILRNRHSESLRRRGYDLVFLLFGLPYIKVIDVRPPSVIRNNDESHLIYTLSCKNVFVDKSSLAMGCYGVYAIMLWSLYFSPTPLRGSGIIIKSSLRRREFIHKSSEALISAANDVFVFVSCQQLFRLFSFSLCRTCPRRDFGSVEAGGNGQARVGPSTFNIIPHVRLRCRKIMR